MGLLRRRRPYEPDRALLRDQARQVTESAEPVRIATSQPGALGPEQGAYVRLPGANFAPAGSIPVDQIGDANIAAGATATLVTVIVPPTLRLKITGIGFDTDDPVAIGYLTWAILLGPDPAPGYSQMLAAIGSVRQLAALFLVSGSSQTLTVRASIGATAPITYRYICRLLGWFYSEKEGP